MNGFASLHFEWVYSPENFFQRNLCIPFDGGTIEIRDGVVTAKISPAALQTNRSNTAGPAQHTDEPAEKLDEQIDEIAEKIDDKIEKLFHDEQKRSQKAYQLGLPFKVVVRKDGSELIAPA